MDSTNDPDSFCDNSSLGELATAKSTIQTLHELLETL